MARNDLIPPQCSDRAQGPLDARAIARLQRQLRAAVITPADPPYERARRVWNGMVDRFPRLIVQPDTSNDVAAAVPFAREHGLPLSVKGGGHGVAGRAICDGGLVIDLSRMGNVQVDPLRRIASVQGGATLRSLDAGAQEHGLATTAGIYRGTGVAGLALGGGVGLLMRRYGLTCDNLVAAEVVTADGRIVETSESRHPDLFWALRGGGGNFGVVTRMDFALHPLTTIYGGRMGFAFSDVETLGRLYTDVHANAPDELQVYLAFGTGLSGPSASIMLCSTDLPIGEATHDRFRQAIPPLSDRIGLMSYLQMQGHWDDSFPDGHFWYWKSSFLRAISEDAIQVCTEAVARQDLPDCNVDLEPMGGAIGRIAPDATAFADRDAASTLLITTTWTDPRETEERIRWVRETWNSLQPFCKRSTYINYMDQGDEERTDVAYGRNLHRLVEIKRRYDPSNVFRHTANIRP